MDQLAFDVSSFCSHHGISRAKFYQLLQQGLAPKTFRVGRRRLVSAEAAKAWRAEMETLAAESCK